MTRALMEGSEAIVRASIAAGCRFFAGYPMTPFTEVLEHFSALLPEAGGVCVNAESELEAVGMTWGALSGGHRAATGSTGQGLSLMQESLAEMTLAELPAVVFNMARGQSDYFQATRGGGHGDYRHVVLAPMDVAEAVALTQLAFHLADKWRNPVLLYGDFFLAHTWEAVDLAPAEFPPLPPKDWAVDGSRNGTGESRFLASIGFDKVGRPTEGPEGLWRRVAAKHEQIAATETRVDTAWIDDADTVVVAFGTLAKFARAAVRDLRAEGHRVGWVRPVTLWPFPTTAIAEAGELARKVLVLENNAGQMIDDVRLGVLGRAPVEAIGGISTDDTGFGIGGLYDSAEIRSRVLDATGSGVHA